MPAPSRRPSPLRRRLILFVAATVFATLMAEIGCRVWGAVSGTVGPERFLTHDPDLGWRNLADFEGRHITDSFDVAVRFDARGQRRGKAALLVGSAPRPLVLAIGDSTTFGWGVEEEETFVALLRKKLEADIRNLGVTGYGTDQQLLLLRRSLSTQEPRLVIVTHTRNDVYEVQHDYLYRRNKPRFLVEGDTMRLTGVPAPRSWLAESSHLLRTMMKHLGSFDADVETMTEPARAIGRGLIMQLYREMYRECFTRGIKFALAAVKSDWLRDFAAREAIPYLDLSSTFDQLAATGPIRFEHDPHWLPRLHEAVASEFEAFVTSADLLRD